MTRQTTPRQVAYHEAGHVVAFAHAGLPIPTASVENGVGDDPRNLGGIETGPGRCRRRAYCTAQMAGMVGGRIGTGARRYNWGGASGDLEALHEAGYTKRWARKGIHGAQWLLRRPRQRRQLHAIAAALVQCRRLEQDEITAILRSAGRKPSRTAQDGPGRAIGNKRVNDAGRAGEAIVDAKKPVRKAVIHPFRMNAKNRLHSSEGQA